MPDLPLVQETRNHAHDAPAGGKRGVGEHAHEPDAATAVHQGPLAPRDLVPTARAAAANSGSSPLDDPQKTAIEVTRAATGATPP